VKSRDDRRRREGGDREGEGETKERREWEGRRKGGTTDKGELVGG